MTKFKRKIYGNNEYDSIEKESIARLKKEIEKENISIPKE